MAKKDIVRYDNELNQVSFRKWNSLESDLFFSIVSKMQGKGTSTVTFDTDELKKLVDFAAKNGKRWESLLTSVSQKVGALTYVEQTGRKIRVMALFSMFEIDLDSRTLTVEVSRHYEYVVNKLQANFTQFELEEFGQLRSTYSKALYRLLKQWRHVGKREFTMAEFRAYLGIPKSYDGKAISKRVIAPIEAELPRFFRGLSVEVVRARKAGRPIVGYEFTWQAEPKPEGKWVENRFEKPRREGEKAVRERRARDAAERRQEAQKRAEERRERDARSAETAARIAAARAAHGGSMFAGSPGWRPVEGAEDVPLFD